MIVNHVRIVLVLHGSDDQEYIESVRSFTNKVGVHYAFASYAHPLVNEVIGDVYIPLFIGYGKDYEKAVNTSGFLTPPILEWPGFRNLLLSLGPGLYVFHGENDEEFNKEVRNVGINDIAFLTINPTLTEYLHHDCPNKVIPVVLTRGIIYRKIVSIVKETCPDTHVEKPLLELEGFVKYFKESLNWVISNTRCLQCLGKQ